MFIRVKKIGPYEYLYLVENAREGGRHVQRVIKALGRRDAVEDSDLLDGLIASAARLALLLDVGPGVLLDFGPPAVPQPTVSRVTRGAWSGLERQGGFVRAASSGA
jgi:hypothetical protein